jgi:hypothetical protein
MADAMPSEDAVPSKKETRDRAQRWLFLQLAWEARFRELHTESEADRVVELSAAETAETAETATAHPGSTQA